MEMFKEVKTIQLGDNKQYSYYTIGITNSGDVYQLGYWGEKYLSWKKINNYTS